MIPREEVLAMRRDYLKAIHTEGFSWIDFTDSDDWGIPWNPLEYPGGGLGIPWEEDELSAQRSLSTHFTRLTHLNSEEPAEMHANSAFRYLALGVFTCRQFDWRRMSSEHVKMPPISAPFEASPWQKARELHLRRPDLKVR